MVKIKLARTGKKHEPHYRIVVVEARSKTTGEYVDNLGTYNPITKTMVLQKEKYASWLTKGAQPTLTVANLVKKQEKTA